MIRQKIKLAWKTLPSGIKRAIGLAAGVAGLLLELAADDDNKEQQGDSFAEMYLDEKGNVTHEPTSVEFDPWGTNS